VTAIIRENIAVTFLVRWNGILARIYDRIQGLFEDFYNDFRGPQQVLSLIDNMQYDPLVLT